MIRSRIVAVSLTVAAALPGIMPSLAEPQSSKHVVEALLAAMMANDAPTIRSLFRADASQQYVNGPHKMGDAFRRWVETDVIAVAAQVDGTTVSVRGADVVVTGTIHNNTGYRTAAVFRFIVEAGKIKRWHIRD
jgi:SnoaL-like domain